MKTYLVQTYTLYETQAETLEEAMQLVGALKNQPVMVTEIILGNAFHEVPAYIDTVFVLESTTKAINKPEKILSEPVG